MKLAGLLVVIAACGGGAAPGDVDANSSLMDCMPIGAFASCTSGQAVTELDFGGGSTSLTLCHAPPIHAHAACASCAVTATENPPASGDFDDYVTDPSVLCAETPAAVVGSACHVPPLVPGDTPPQATPCLPTRVRLNADGTVAGQDYLTCDPGTGTCVPGTAPTIMGYFEACTPAVITQYGTSGAVGVVDLPAATGTLGSPAPEACLIAWDATAQAATSGMTIRCMGDWDCPAGALCDDQLTVLSASGSPMAVCKPGPRGTLTPAMLTR